jgi:signal transduction histidine kinase
MGVALDANARLRGAYEVGFQIASAKTWLNQPIPNPAQAAGSLDAATAKLDAYQSQLGDDAHMLQARTDIVAAQAHIFDTDGQAARSLDAALGELTQFSSDARNTIVSRQDAANAKHRATLLFVIALSAVAVFITAGLALWQYRSVVGPLRRLSQAVQRMAGGKLNERLSRRGDAEFVQLSDHFNHMAAQLDDLYRSLEKRVADKSKELIRSDRLASVGYLAAGVAHEINNPLGIITGYGERSLAQLKSGLNDATLDKIETSLNVICEEAFRAKGITDRLLSLARPAAESRGPVCLVQLVREMASTLLGLSKFADHKVILPADDISAPVSGSAGELKQVVLNLLVNAFDAVAPPDGQVIVTLSQEGQWVELVIADNGRGMTPDTLEHLFEPFFTDRPRDRPGTGLGLSIAHAIVADHGGSIRAESAGPQRGSRLIVRLPGLAPENVNSPGK